MTLWVYGGNLDFGEALRRHVLEKVEAMVARCEVASRVGAGLVNVVCRRRDGAIGWLDPQASRDPPGAA